jgi:outer membrane murein-binding lipoprotein Lpp
MLTFLFSRMGLSIILIIVIGMIIGGLVLYIRTSAATIRELRSDLVTLNIQATSLRQANENMARDIAAVRRLQQETNRSLQATRLQAAQTAQTIQQRKFNNNPTVLQGQINQDMTAIFDRLQGLSHAP